MLSFLRKLSIGGKIKDGDLPARMMGSPDEILKIKIGNNLDLKDEGELKECVYGNTYFLYCCIKLL